MGDEVAIPLGRGEGLLDSGEHRRGYLRLAVTTFAVTMALNVFQAIAPNFFRDELGMDGAQNGYLIAIRELPGFLLIFVAAVLLRFGLARATATSLVLMAVGFAAIAGVNSFPGLILPTLVASVGYHSWLQLQDALGLSLAARGEEGSVLGRLRGIGFAGTLVGLVAVFAMLLGVEWSLGDLRAHQGPWLRGAWLMVGAAALIGAIAVARFPEADDARAAARAAPRITWRREYGLYYWLTFLDGSRQQIYFAFAPFVLVEEFGVNARTLLLLLIVSAIINWRSGGWIGRLVDRYGEKRMLTVGYSLHLLVFLGFALSRNIWFLYATYLGYNFLFLFSIGTTTYLRKICRRQDLAPSLAVGVSLAHVTAVVVPVVGAALWERLGYQFPFLFGTAFIFVSLWLTQRIDVRRQRVAEAPPDAVGGIAGQALSGQAVEPPASGQPRLDPVTAAAGRE
ncbi:MAG: MFS transporter [Chloroflexota bacterium]|nr:MFS transporter [Chloroflexota bacterium]